MIRENSFWMYRDKIENEFFVISETEILKRIPEKSGCEETKILEWAFENEAVRVE